MTVNTLSKFPPTSNLGEQRLDLRSSSLTRLSRGTIMGWLRVATLVSGDCLCLFLSCQILKGLGVSPIGFWHLQNDWHSLLPLLLTELVLIATGGLYQGGEHRRNYWGIARAITLAYGLILFIFLLYWPDNSVAWKAVSKFWLLNILLTCTARFGTEVVVKVFRRQGIARYNAFVIAEQAQQQGAISLLDLEDRYNILGIEDAVSLDRNNREETFRKIRSLNIAEVFITWNAIKNRTFLCWRFRTAGISLRILPIGSGVIFKNLKLWSVGGVPSSTMLPPAITGSDFLFKRCFDFCAAVLLLLVFSPLYLFIALLIKLDSPGPVFYKQDRVGLHGQTFKAWKFRTMVQNAETFQKELEAQNETKDGVLFKMKEDPRITPVGKFLRQFSLDELPQVFNVLFGDMSLVGPRPLPVRDVQRFSKAHFFIRHEVLPGITGLWQVSGRADVPDFDQVIRMDMTYIENWSPWLDLKILLQTVGVVLAKRGAY